MSSTLKNDLHIIIYLYRAHGGWIYIFNRANEYVDVLDDEEALEQRLQREIKEKVIDHYYRHIFVIPLSS